MPTYHLLFISMLAAKRLYNPKISPPRQVWVETFIGVDSKLLGITELHPRVFGVFPRIDQLSNDLRWQKTYRNIDYTSLPTRNELPGGYTRPWPQKGTGRARHKSVNSPIFIKGGWLHGPRGPVTSFKDRNVPQLTNAMRVILSIKLAQNDIRVVDSISDYKNEDPKVLEEQLECREWGPSVLIVDDETNFSEPLIKSTSSIPHVNLMSIVGLNSMSLCKHETLVITQNALQTVQEKLLYQLLRVDLCNTYVQYRQPQKPD